MDFKIAYGSGQPDMTWTPADSIANNVWLSLNVRRGAFFALPNFGHRFHLLEKNTAAEAAKAEQYAREALAWLVAIGRAASVEVTAERDPENYPDRLMLRGAVVQSDGRRLSFEHFIEVI